MKKAILAAMILFAVSTAGAQKKGSEKPEPVITDPTMLLMEACRSGSLVAAQNAVARGANINYQEPPDKFTPLGIALWHKRLTVANYLISKGADINLQSCGVHPFYYAAGSGNIAMVRLFLSKGASPNSLSSDKSTPLHAAAGGSLDILYLLVGRGADVNAASESGWTPLFYTIASGTRDGNLPAMKYLVSKGARIDAKLDSGETPLIYSLSSKKSAITRYLISINADKTGVPEYITKSDSFGTTLFHEAVQERDLEAVKLYLELGADVNAKGPSDRTPLNWLAGMFTANPAEKQKLLAIATILTQKKAGVNAADDKGRTPLLTYLNAAGSTDSPEFVQLLLKAGAQVSLQDKTGDNAISMARTRKFNRIAALLVAAGVNTLDAVDDKGTTALHRAATAKNAEEVQSLLNRGANPDMRDRNGRTPLHYAVLKPNARVLTILAAKADLNAKDNRGATPLMLNIWERVMDTECLRILIGKGANPNISGMNTFPILHAASLNRVDIVELLMELGADVNVTDNRGNNLLMHVAGMDGDDVRLARKVAAKTKNINARSADHDRGEGGRETALLQAESTTNWKTARYLAEEAGADINIPDKTGHTPLMTALNHKHTGMIRFLVGKGANINTVTQEGRTPLWFAAYTGDLDSVKLFLEKGAKADIPIESGETPLARAAMEGNLDIVKLLAEKGASLNSREKSSGYTPLHWAVRAGSAETVRFLVGKGADPSAKGVMGKTPYDMAQEAGNQSMMEILRKEYVQ